ncbi:MAG: hypothetical protein JNL58_01425 [Planctomyces sp.]|nr:hypothetical protein [Planctomyces sp.]
MPCLQSSPAVFAAVICFTIHAAFSAPSVNAQNSAPGESHGVSYYRSVRPILQRRCSGCHFAGKREGGLSVVNVADLLTGGEGGPALVAGKPDDSHLVSYVSGEKPEMPLNAEPLKPAEVETLRTWIAQGAEDDTPASLGNPISAENPPVYKSPPVITSIDYSPDGQWIAVSGYHEVLLHQLSGAGETAVRRLVGRSQRIESLSFSPDGKLLAVAGGTPSLFGEVQIWSLADGKLLQSVTMSHDTLFGISFNADSTLVAFGGADNRLRAMEVATGKVVMQMDAHSDWVLGTTFSLKNDHLLSVSRDRSMKLTIVANGQFVDNVTSITPGALKGGLVDVQRHPTAEEVLTAGSDGEPRLYKIFRTQARVIGDDFNLVRAFPALPGRVCDLDFSASGDKFVCGSSTALGGAARIYTTTDAAKTIDLPEIKVPVYAVSFRPDEQQVAVAGFDGIVRLYNASNGQLERSLVSVPVPAVTAQATAESN